MVYDRGSAGMAEILASARKTCSVVFVCDGDGAGAAEHAARARELADALDVTGMSFTQRCAALSALGADGIVTFSERRLPATARLAEACGLPFHSPEVVTGLIDKRRQRELLRAAGVESTRCVTVRGAADMPAALAEVGLPAVVKPRSGAGSVDTCRVDTARRAAEVAAELMDGEREFVVEELLVGDPRAAGAGFGDYVSVESVVLDGVVRHVCVTGKLPLAEPFRETGMFQPAALPGPLTDRVLELTGDAIRALGIVRGVTHVEIKLTPDGPRLIEVNGRLGGYVGALLRRAAGFDLLRAALRAALSLPTEVPELAFRAVEFVYFVTPGADAGTTLARVDGLEEVAAMAGVWQVAVDARAGRRLHWRDGTEGHLGTVHGRVDDHDRLREIVAAIASGITLGYA